MTTSAILTQVDLNTEVDRYPPQGSSGRRSEILLKTSSLRVILVTMRAGTALQEHSAPGTITVQPIRGRFAFMAGNEEREIAPGSLISVADGVRHTVRALEDGAFLLTIGWLGADAVDDPAARVDAIGTSPAGLEEIVGEHQSAAGAG